MYAESLTLREVQAIPLKIVRRLQIIALLPSCLCLLAFVPDHFLHRYILQSGACSSNLHTTFSFLLYKMRALRGIFFIVIEFLACKYCHLFSSGRLSLKISYHQSIDLLSP